MEASIERAYEPLPTAAVRGQWSRPGLTCFGSVQQLTAGGSIGAGECDGASPDPDCSLPNFPGQPGNAGHPFYNRF